MPKFLQTGNALKRAEDIVKNERDAVFALSPEQWEQLLGFRWGKPKKRKEADADMKKLIEFLWK